MNESAKRAVSRAYKVADKVSAPAERFFDTWIQRGAEGGGAYSDVSIRKYRQIWEPWLKFLASRDVAWDEPTPADLSDYLSSLRCSFKGRGGASDVTRRRYWAVLGDLYDMALTNGLVGVNPADSSNNPGPNQTAVSTVIHPRYLAKLRLNLPPEDLGDWKSARDRALLAVLIDAGLTSGELQALEVTSVVRVVSTSQVELLVTGGEGEAMRRVPLPTWSAALLSTWLTARSQLVPAPESDRIFISKRGRKPLESTDVLHIVTQWLKEVLPMVGLRRVDHMGANVLRTAAIIWWRDVEGLDNAALLARSGIAQVQSLRRLPAPESKGSRPRGQ